MNQFSAHRSRTALRLVAWALLLCTCGTLVPGAAQGQDVAAPGATDAATTEAPGFWMLLAQNLFNSRGMMAVLGQPEYTAAAFLALNLIVFVETGLLVGFFLPGDSLLVTAGLIASNPACGWSLPLLLVSLSLSAIMGDTIGYAIGYKTGPRIFSREKSLLFNKDHLLKAQHFYERHGGKTIILARFMPILRTFAPVVAGVGGMQYRRFLAFNVIGGVAWVFSMVLFGYLLPSVINPLLQPLFGPEFLVQDHIEKVVILVVLASIAPGIFAWLQAKMAGKSRANAELVGTAK